MTYEKVSLIMTTYNCADHAAQTIKSALSQDYPNLELVIVDGASTDGTAEIIRRYAAAHPNTIRWVSEPDQGIYDGMNKGIRLAGGDIIAVFNDLFTCPDAVHRMAEAIREENVIGAHADLAYMDGDRVVRKWQMGQGRIEDGWMPAHPTLYLRREVYERYGLYDTGYRSSSDYEFMVRILKDPANRLAYVPEELIHMYYGGTSNDGAAGYLRNIREAYQALCANDIRHPALVIVRRILRTLRQFRAE